MQDTHSPLARLLAAYYGFVQAMHMVAITRSYTLLRQRGEITFLAQPPLGGWSAQAEHFLISLGGLDFINALFALIFVYGYFSRSHWWRWLGTTTLTASMVSSLIYAYGTVASGAWTGHVVRYLTLVVLFIPIVILAILFGIWGIKDWEIKNHGK